MAQVWLSHGLRPSEEILEAKLAWLSYKKEVDIGSRQTDKRDKSKSNGSK
jgi:hypothetical protein